MATRLDHRIQRLRARKTDTTKGVRTRSATFAKSEGRFDTAKDALDYISETMLAVDTEYTKLTFDECDRVQGQVKAACDNNSVGVSFRHQGSVTNDTHIRFYSDIDLLAITDKYHDLQVPLEPTSPYKGDPMADLKEIRKIVEERLTTSFPQAKVDKSGSKAVSISGGSLKRKIDIIAASWLETEEYRRRQQEDYKGVKVLDLDGPKRISNFPFLHNWELNDKDRNVSGKLKSLIRFVKSARYDADDKIDVSSYDIASLCYQMPLPEFSSAGTDYALAHSFLQFADRVRTDQDLQKTLYVPNKTRLIFCENGVTPDALKKLNEEIYGILAQAQSSRSFT